MVFNFKLKEFLYRIYRKFNVFNFKLSSKVIVHGQASRLTALKKYNVNNDKIIINPYGIEKINSSRVKTINKEFNISKNTKIILSAGRITKDKGVEEFCEIAKRMSNKKLKFIFLGHHRDNKYYQNIIKKYSKYVLFTGMRKDIEKFYKSSYVFLFLSHRESAGLVLVEAMNFKLPLIGWDIIGVNEIIKKNYNGELIKFGDINKAVEKIRNLLNNKAKYIQFSKNSFNSLNDYKIEASADRLINIFKKIEKNKQQIN